MHVSRTRRGLWAVGAALVVCANAAATDLRDWTVRDSVALTYFTTYQQDAALWETRGAPSPIVPSPDGRHFFFVRHRGDLDCDCNEYTLDVYSSNDVIRQLPGRNGSAGGKPEALRKVALRSASNDPAINHARWLDGDTIAFLGTRDGPQPQVFSLSVETGKLVALTDGRHRVATFDVRGDAIAFTAVTATKPLTALDEYPMAALKSDELSALLSPRDEETRVLFAGAGGSARAILELSPGYQGPWISEDGRHAIVALSSSTATPNRQIGFLLIDVRGGSARPVFPGTPTGIRTEVGRELRYQLPPSAFWFNDSRHVILTNAATPGTREGDSESTAAAVIGYDSQTGDWKVLEPLRHGDKGRAIHVSGARWLNSGKDLLISHQTESGQQVDATVYSWGKSGWHARSMPASAGLPSGDREALLKGLKVFVRQQLNEPPIVVAQNLGREVSLTDPDAALRGIWRAKAEKVEWRDPNGEMTEGALMLPRNYVRGMRLPLVVQADYLPDAFMPDGRAPTAYAAQPLVARGMAVLQISHHVEGRTTPREMPAFVERLDASVEYLAAQGLIDPSRVGLVGFSRAGWLTYYAITHPRRTKLAASITADSWSGSFGEYLFRAASSVAPAVDLRPFEKQFGEGTYWEDKDAWHERTNSFNVDRVQTPALFTVHGKYNQPWAFETIAAFRLNKRPLEYLFFPRAAHQLRLPREREASLQATVDWMAFWLQGETTSTADKDARYARWRTLRAELERLKTEPASGAR